LQDIAHKGLFDLPDLGMPYLQYKADPEINRVLIQKNKKEFINAFFIFPLVTVTGPVKIEISLGHQRMSAPIDIRLNIMQPYFKWCGLFTDGFHE